MFSLDREYPYPKYSCIGKPGGFWYGINEEWLKWAWENEFNIPYGFKYRYFVFVDESKIYKVDTAEKVREISTGSEILDRVKDIILETSTGGEILDRVKDIILKKYCGLEFNPYLYGRARMENLWYSGVDCSSGVVWNLEAIKGIRLDTSYRGTEREIEDRLEAIHS